MKRLLAVLAGAARLFDFSDSIGTARRRELLNSLQSPHADDWGALCQDGQKVQADLAKVWDSRKGKS